MFGGVRVPDEFALVTTMQQLGVVFFSRTPDSVTINFVCEALRLTARVCH